MGDLGYLRAGFRLSKGHISNYFKQIFRSIHLVVDAFIANHAGSAELRVTSRTTRINRTDIILFFNS